MLAMKENTSQFVICIRNDEYPASLEKRKLYQIIPDPEATKSKYLRVVDESGEDYLYPESYFIDAGLSAETQAIVSQVVCSQIQ